MATSLKKLPKSQVEITLTIDKNKLASQYEIVYQKMAKDVTLKGFRPGKAPRHLTETTIGSEKIYQEALNDLLFEVYRDAIKEHQLTPISYPEFKVGKFDPQKDVQVTVKISLRPQAKVKDYQKIKVKKQEVKKATDKEVKELIETSFTSWKEKTKNQNVGTESFQPNIKVETATTLSEAKQKAESEKPNEKKDEFFDISKLKEPTFDDFLKVNLVKTREELEKKVHITLNEQKTLQNEKQFVNQIFEELLKKTEIELPEILIEQELSEMEKNLETQFRPVGISLDEYLQHKKKSREELKKEWRPQAEKNVKIEFALAALAEAEKIVIQDEEVQKTLNSVADPKIRQELEKPHQKVYIKYSLQREKTIEKLKEIAGT